MKTTDTLKVTFLAAALGFVAFYEAPAEEAERKSVTQTAGEHVFSKHPVKLRTGDYTKKVEGDTTTYNLTFFERKLVPALGFSDVAKFSVECTKAPAKQLNCSMPSK